MYNKEEIYNKLKELGIQFEITEHNAAFTINQMKEVDGIKIEDVCKNLFLRDDHGRRHFLLVMREEKTADLKSLREQICSSRLGFASEERLSEYLGLTRGSVTPLGLFNDENHEVEVLIDRDLDGRRHIGVHPCDNTATVWLSFDSLKKIIGHCGNRFMFVKL